MGSFTKFMASAIFFIVLSFFLVPTRAQEEGFIYVVISSKGLEFSKDLLIEQTSDSGIALIASGAKANLSMDWCYSYSTWLFDISDQGDASIQVEGMEVGVTLALNGQEETLKLSVLECGRYVNDISIKLDGGASWLYQWLVDAFEGQIVFAVEDNISKKIREGIMKLDSLLQSLPKQIALDDIAALNVTFVGNPVFNNSSIEFQINGLFMAPNDDFASSLYNKDSLDPVPFNAPAKMVEILLHENVFSSVSLVFFNQYPNEDMELNISVSSPPIMTVVNNGINITIYSDVTIGVMNVDEVIPVACISLAVLSTILKTIVVPYVNLHLWKGLPLPLPHGFTLHNSEIISINSRLTIFSDVAIAERSLTSYFLHLDELGILVSGACTSSVFDKKYKILKKQFVFWESDVFIRNHKVGQV
ncbi:hypothetical protein GBA52_014703 [Prunus armeniaca]|nr:hypothetical protein GBA52_014703 [Prunus armeniaca]